MKKILLLGAAALISLCASAQDKKLDKVRQLYEAGQWEECVENAKKYNSANSQKPDGYFYLGLSYYEMYKKNPQKEFQMTSAENTIHTALSKDKQQTVRKQFEASLSEMREKVTELQDKYYASGDKTKAGQHAGILAKIWKDTTDAYRHIFMPELFVEPVTYGKQLAAYDGPANETDVLGRKQGVWIEKYPNGRRKSQITFQDGKPKGDFYRFYEKGGISAHLYFYSDSLASAILYEENGDKSAMGYYYNRKKDSLWQYFQGDSLLVAEEMYTRGIKNGKETTYFMFGFPAEEITWKNGVKDGPWKRFYESSTPIFETSYKNGKLHGSYTKYDIKGKTLIMGNYRDDLKDGTWSILDESTGKYNKVKYVNGQPENVQDLDEAETKKMMEQLEKGKLLPDPKDYIQDPTEFPRN